MKKSAQKKYDEAAQLEHGLRLNQTCPCCGSDHLSIFFQHPARIVCRTCGINTGDQPSLDQAVAVWNRRPTSTG